MSPTDEQPSQEQSSAATCTLMILGDGRVLARNVTPALARLLHTLCPDDESLLSRGTVAHDSPETFPRTSPDPS